MAFDRAHSDATLTTTVTFPRKSLSARGAPYCDSVKSYNESTDAAARDDDEVSIAIKAAASVVTRAKARRRVVVASSGVADVDDTTSPFPPSTVRASSASRDASRVARIPHRYAARDDSTRRVVDARPETFAREARATRMRTARVTLWRPRNGGVVVRARARRVLERVRAFAGATSVEYTSYHPFASRARVERRCVVIVVDGNHRPRVVRLWE